MSSQWRTTAEAAAAAGVATDTFRGLMRDARRAGIDLRARRELWPDARTPLYDAVRLDEWLANRPRRRRRRNSQTAAATEAATADVGELADAFSGSAGPVRWAGQFDIADAGSATLTVTLNGNPVPTEIRDTVVALASSLSNLAAGQSAGPG